MTEINWLTNFILIDAGERGAILHVNRQHIAQNAKDGGRRPVYTLKPNGPHSKAVYARKVTWDGTATAVADEDQLACGARAWIEIAPGVQIGLTDAMDYSQAKEVA